MKEKKKLIVEYVFQFPWICLVCLLSLNVVINHFPCATKWFFCGTFNKSKSKPLFHLLNWQPKPTEIIMLPSHESMLAIFLSQLNQNVFNPLMIFLLHILERNKSWWQKKGLISTSNIIIDKKGEGNTTSIAFNTKRLTYLQGTHMK